MCDLDITLATAHIAPGFAGMSPGLPAEMQVDMSGVSLEYQYSGARKAVRWGPGVVTLLG